MVKYQVLSQKEKKILNVSIELFSVLFIIGAFYNVGEVIGSFLYVISH